MTILGVLANIFIACMAVVFFVGSYILILEKKEQRKSEW